jgi:hypothetical protein
MLGGVHAAFVVSISQTASLIHARITVETSKGKWQGWFCHAACFKSRIAADKNLDPAHF